jgi:FkbH-like protein
MGPAVSGELDWLKEAPADFRARLKALRSELTTASPAYVEEQLYKLALTRLDINQLTQLAHTVEAYLAQRPAAGPLARASLGLIGAGTLSLLAPAIVASALRHRVLCHIVLGDYGRAMQDALDETSSLKSAGLDMVLVIPDHRMLGLDRPVFADGAAKATIGGAVNALRAIVDGLSGTVPSLIVANVVPPAEPLFGSFDAVEPGTTHAMVAAVNATLVEWAARKDIVLLDAARLAAGAGLERWHDNEQWHAAKFPFSPDLIPLYADAVARLLAAIRGTTRKCLVLDLDHTLWGGVIGDDGVGGIVLGQGSAKGEAFLAIQQAALALRSRGIVLAVCSKNDQEVARQPFREHPDMIIREEHIAVFAANWIDKATNLREIASTLNIGLDALVFLDDNPAEREQVRRELPMVAVPELPDDPARYPGALLNAGYFEAVSFVQEDRDRADAYTANALRASAGTTSDMAGYLSELQMRLDVRPFDEMNRARIAQLINKSNQFNLTTRRYTESEVAAMERDPAKLTMQLRLDDRFGANGMISVIIVDRATWEIDTWLMSCRVLGRRVEEAALAQIVAAGRQAGAEAITGRHIPTAKNAMVAGHYRKLGFKPAGDDAGGATRWRLRLADYAVPDLPMQINSRILG